MKTTVNRGYVDLQAPGAKLAAMLTDQMMNERNPSSGTPNSISDCNRTNGFVCRLNMDSTEEIFQEDFRKRYQRYWVKTVPADVLIAIPNRFASMFDVAET